MTPAGSCSRSKRSRSLGLVAQISPTRVVHRGLARLVQAGLRRYALAEAAAVAPFIEGRRVLDLGAGEGHVARALAGVAWVCGCDVGPFRKALLQRIPSEVTRAHAPAHAFREPALPYVVYDGWRLPFADRAFDTALILLALHHCADPERVVDEAIRVTHHRLLVTESVADTRRDRFWLGLLDGRLNALRHGGAMPAPLAFRTSAGWRALFAARGLRLLAERPLAPWWERLIHHPVLYVLERPG